MSAYTTLYISREKALTVLAERLLGKVSNETLGNMLDPLVASRLYNILVVDERTEDDDLI